MIPDGHFRTGIKLRAQKDQKNGIRRQRTRGKEEPIHPRNRKEPHHGNARTTENPTTLLHGLGFYSPFANPD